MIDPWWIRFFWHESNESWFERHPDKDYRVNEEGVTYVHTERYMKRPKIQEDIRKLKTILGSKTP